MYDPLYAQFGDSADRISCMCIVVGFNLYLILYDAPSSRFDIFVYVTSWEHTFDATYLEPLIGLCFNFVR